MSTKYMNECLQCLSILICVLCMELSFVKGNSRCSKQNPPSINTNLSINNSQGTIYSPDYSLTSPYPSNTHCDWTISGPIGYVIQLTFTIFELEPSSSSNSRNCVDVDFVRVYDGWKSSASLLGVYCGILGKFSVRSTTRFMWVQFRSNLRVEGKGFKADYEVIKDTRQDPPDGKKVPIALIIGVVTLSLIIVIGIIFLAAGGKDSLLRKRARRRLNTRSSRVSSNSSQAPLASMKSLPRATPNSETQSLRGSICSSRPLSSRAFTPRNYSLPQLVVTNEEGKQTLILPQRELRTHVLIHSSPFSKRRLPGLRRLSTGSPTSIRRNNQISPTATHAQSFLVGTQRTRSESGFRRHSSGSIRYNTTETMSGFNPTLQDDGILKSLSGSVVLSNVSLQIVQPCSPDEYETLTSIKGRFSSPHFPNYFQKATQCNWLINVAPGYVVALQFDTFEVGLDAECSNRESRTNFVEVRDGMEHKNRTIGIFCGSIRPEEISSSGNQVWIRYVTSGYRSTKFEARYSATKDSSASTIILLASAAIIGTIFCISITIAIVKRKHRDHDDEAGLNPIRDDAEMDNNRACALEQLPAFVLGVADDSETSQTNKKQSPSRSLLNKQTSHVRGEVDKTDVHLHDNGESRMNRLSMGEHNLAISDLTDIDNENPDMLDGLKAPSDAAATDQRGSHSGSILTATKMIFVQDSSSSRSSTSSSNNSFEQ
ncbi:tolloid-like protein 1 [Actinia tenebrosa]|uniref:Tolloid-like protein 1 n=1 Tax=Actinia tenebrosa TaxID=6105 RepID=A0A6P8HBS7_ACTTE|nr:tolloid-like protein 1 [Actinia tenebrosa]